MEGIKPPACLVLGFDVNHFISGGLLPIGLTVIHCTGKLLWNLILGRESLSLLVWV